ncbi:MAG: hypothetical protein R3275_03820 [Saprospiraceae bacterium]|nr:hypothetical protein [Saprospiraceae bacterium]
MKSKKKLTKTQLTFLESKGNVSLHDVVSQQFSNLFNSYAQQYNHAFERKGNLFNTNVKRIRINDQFQLRWLIYYIHSNPWHHGICDDFSHYPWNSFGEIISGRLDVIDRSIYSIYEGKESLIEYHKTAHLHKALKQLTFSSENEDVQGIKLLQ